MSRLSGTKIALSISLLPLLASCDDSPPTASEEELKQVLQQWEREEPSPGPTAGDEVLRRADGLLVPLPPVAPEPEALSDSFLVILMSSPTPKAMPQALATLADHPELASQVVRASSSWFQGLMPCYEITIAGAFEHRRQATALSRQLEGLGVDNYVKQAGRYVGSQRVVEAWCRGDHAPRHQGCGELRFVEVHDGRAWLWLAADPVVTERALEGAESPQPLGGLRAWSSSLSAETIDEYDEKQRWQLYAPTTGQKLDKCSVAGFAAITRGQPHFGYLEQQPTPTGPGCGEPELFASLACKETPRDLPLVALPSDHEEPVLYTPLAALRDIELEDDAKALATRDPAFTKAFQRAHRHANERSEPLQQLVTLRGFVAPDRKVLLVELRLQTGDGVVWCGQDDVRVDLSALFEWTKDGNLGANLIPFRVHENVELIGMIDVDADGTPELLQRRWPNEIELWRAGSEEPCAIAQAYCDCPC